jgi:xylose dehydrogenase (NAD/NADP)
VNDGSVRIGVIGTSWYAETHMASIAALPHARLTAVAGRNRERAVEVARRHHAPHVFSDYRDLIVSGTVDALVIVAPDGLHGEIAIDGFRHGLHVLCEKPLGRTAEEAKCMATAAEASGLVHMSYFGLRTTPHHRYLGALVESGLIGEIRSASFTLAHGMFRSPKYNWRFDARYGGGVIADLGCYVFDLARLYIGDVGSVVAHGRSHVARPASDGTDYPPADDSGMGVLAFRNGAHATFEVSVVSSVGPGFQRSTIELQGELGRLELTHNFDSATITSCLGDATSFVPMELPADFESPTGDAEFVEAILNGSRVTPGFSDGWRVQQIVDGAIASARSGSWVQIERESLS